MSELTFMIIRLAFLALLWIFIFGIVYALRSDLFGAPVKRLRDRNKAEDEPFVAPAPAALAAAPAGVGTVGTEPVSGSSAPATDFPSAGSASPARTLLITSGVANGTEINLDEDLITIGRSPDSTLVLVDDYTSTHHAELRRTASGWTLTDLDSTNGTKVDDRRISGSVELPIFVPATIGATTFELRP